MKKAVALAVVVLLFVLGVRSFRGTGERSNEATFPEPAGLAVAPVVHADEPPPTPATSARAPAEPVPAPVSAATTGSLLVSVTWPDGSPAAGVSALVWPDEDDELVRSFRKLSTLDEGHGVLGGLAPGAWRVRLDRETSSERVEIRAGEETSVALAVSGGSRLEGVVVDEHGRPVAGAGVWISPRQPQYLGGEPLDDWLAATTGADGRFAIPALGKAWIIGARAEGYSPSRDKPVRWKRPVEEVRLVLPGLGGAIEGRVLGPDDAPVAGAVVSGDMGLRYWESVDQSGTKGWLILNNLPLRTISGDDGTFRFGGVQPGSVELTVSSRNHRSWSQEVQVSASATARVEATLERGETLSGRVLSPDGAPLAGLLVFARNEAYDAPVDPNAAWLQQSWSQILENHREEYATARSRADGSYRLEGLQAGWTFVAVESGDAGRVLQPLRIEAGVETTEDLVVARGLELRCRIIDSNGTPLPDLPVFVAREAGNGGTAGSLGAFKTDAEGLLAVPSCKDAPYSLDIRHPHLDETLRSPDGHGLRPGEMEHIVVVEYSDTLAARVSGLVLDDAGQPLAGARVDRIRLEGGSIRIATTDSTGAFHSEAFQPGTYRFWIRAPDFPIVQIGACSTQPGETLDLGIVRMRTPGFLDVALRREDGGPIDDERMRVDLYRPDGGYAWSTFEVELGVARSDAITPGDYVLRVEGAEDRPVHVEAGATQELEVVLPAAK